MVLKSDAFGDQTYFYHSKTGLAGIRITTVFCSNRQPFRDLPANLLTFFCHQVTDTNGTGVDTDFARQVSVDEEFSWLDDNNPEHSKPETKNPEQTKMEPSKLYSDVVKHDLDADKSKLVPESTDINSHGDETIENVLETSTEF